MLPPYLHDAEKLWMQGLILASAWKAELFQLKCKGNRQQTTKGYRWKCNGSSGLKNKGQENKRQSWWAILSNTFVHFPLLRRFKASVTAVSLTSPERGGWFKSAVECCIRGGWQEGFSFGFLSNKRRSCVFNLQDNLVSVWFSLLDCSLMSFLCLIN